MANQGAMDLHLLHKPQIDFFHRLVSELGQEPERMRWVMALWLWFESIGHHDFIRYVAASPAPIILHFITEAFACLDRLAGFPGSIDGSLSYTNAVRAEPIDLGYFDIHRKEVMQRVNSFYNNVCRVVYNGIEEARLPNDIRAMLLGGARIGPNGERMSQPRLSPMPQHSTLNPMASPWPPALEPLPEEHRSIFITFLRDFPISEDDIIQFFNSRYGPCVDSVMIERAPAGQLLIYWRVVLSSIAMIPVVLNGQQRANYMIKGRHLWATIQAPN